jgi:acyl-coenzyme A synthetase/AMP-(fatty) acid ligase
MQLIGQSSDSVNFKNSILTDGQLTCTYQDIPEIFENIQQIFNKNAIKVTEPLVLECDNSLPNALLILFFLEKEYSVLLLPKTAAGVGFLPPFCRYHITTAAGSLDPHQFLQIAQNEHWNDFQSVPSNPHFYLRTSGSTGVPKMAVHPHSQLRGNALNCIARLQLTCHDRIAIPVPIFHMFGLGAAFLPSVAVGAAIDLQKGANLLRYLQRETAFNPNVAFMTPIFCETLLKGRKSPRPYRLTVTAGDRFRGETFAKYDNQFGCVVQLYGSTEMGAVAAASPQEPKEIRAQTVGHPLSGVQLQIKSLSGDIAHPPNIGELWCHHPFGFTGYVDNQGLAVDDNPSDWFHTKDWGRLWPTGQIEVLGRSDHSVNRDGLLVFFAEVEKAIETLPEIEAAVVISQGESQRGKKLLAFCLPKPAVSDLTVAKIRDTCFNKLSKHAIPDDIIIVNALPLLSNGKVDRQKLTTMVHEINKNQ